MRYLLNTLLKGISDYKNTDIDIILNQQITHRSLDYCWDKLFIISYKYDTCVLSIKSGNHCYDYEDRFLLEDLMLSVLYNLIFKDDTLDFNTKLYETGDNNIMHITYSKSYNKSETPIKPIKITIEWPFKIDIYGNTDHTFMNKISIYDDSFMPKGYEITHQCESSFILKFNTKTEYN